MAKLKALVCLILVMFTVLVPLTPMASAATQLQTIISFAESKLGQAYLINYCQAFVFQCYKAGGIDNGSASSAKEAWNKYKVSTDYNNIPIGACVYFDTGTFGHVGLYVGNNEMIHASKVAGKVIKSNLSEYMSDYLGWGWQGNVQPSGTEYNPVTITHGFSGIADVIQDTNATLYATITKPSSSKVTLFGFRVKKYGDDWVNGVVTETRPQGSSSGYVGEPKVKVWFDINAELHFTLTHATTYEAYFYVDVDGTRYWSDARIFTTTGSHSYGAWQTTSAASCFKTGTKIRYCSCGKSETGTITALGCTYAGYTVDVPATCTSEGTKSRHCTRCGVVDITSLTAIKATGHSFGAWSTTQSASCTAAGTQKRTCHCGAYETRGISATGHSFGAWKTTVSPSCIQSGTETRICTKCSTPESRQISSLGHNYSSSWTVDSNATCTVSGSKSHHCTRCNAKTDITSIDPLGHKWDEWTTAETATTAKEGKDIRKCKNDGCKTTETRTVPKLPEENHNHSFGEWITELEPSCTEDGIMVSTCTSCSEKQTQSIAALGHRFGEWERTAEPTAEKTGLDERTCAECGQKEQREVERLYIPDAEETVVDDGSDYKNSDISEDGLESDSTQNQSKGKSNDWADPGAVAITIIAVFSAAVWIFKRRK